MTIIEERRLQRYHDNDHDHEDHDDATDARSLRVMRVFRLLPLVAGTLTFLIVGLVAGFMYKPAVTDKRPMFPQPVPDALSMNGRSWKYQTCSCCEDCTYCMHGAFLTWPRVADSLAAAGVRRFWPVILIGLGIAFIGYFLEVATDFFMAETNINSTATNGIFVHLANLIIAIWLSRVRVELRQKFGDHSGNYCCQDFLLYWCCLCCTAIQDARQVDEATGTRVECCCTLLQGLPIPGSFNMNGQVLGQGLQSGTVVVGTAVAASAPGHQMPPTVAVGTVVQVAEPVNGQGNESEGKEV